MKIQILFMMGILQLALAQTIQQPCDPPIGKIIFGTMVDEKSSARMKAIFDSDQEIRNAFLKNQTPTQEDLRKMNDADTSHRVEVMKLLGDGKLSSYDDFYYAAFIFQHGNCSQHYQLANRLAEQAIKLSDKKEARWIYAASLDRYLVSINKPQKFGTQYEFVAPDFSNQCLQPVDPKTTDAERIRYNVPKLQEALARAKGKICPFPQR